MTFELLDIAYNSSTVWVSGTNFPAIDRQLLGMWWGFLFQNPMLGGFLSFLSSWGKYAHADICMDENKAYIPNCVVGPFGINATNSSFLSQENRNFTQLFTDPRRILFFCGARIHDVPRLFYEKSQENVLVVGFD